MMQRLSRLFALLLPRSSSTQISSAPWILPHTVPGLNAPWPTNTGALESWIYKKSLSIRRLGAFYGDGSSVRVAPDMLVRNSPHSSSFSSLCTRY